MFKVKLRLYLMSKRELQLRHFRFRFKEKVKPRWRRPKKNMLVTSLVLFLEDLLVLFIWATTLKAQLCLELHCITFKTKPIICSTQILMFRRFLLLSSLRSSLLTVQLRLSCPALRVREGAQSPSRQEFGQTNGPDLICAQHPSVLLPGERFTKLLLSPKGTAGCLSVTRAFIMSFQAVVKDLFSQFGSVKSVELRDHPGSSEESEPKLSRFFRPAEKRVSFHLTFKKKYSFLYTASYIWLSCSVCFRASKWATLCLKARLVWQQPSPILKMILWWSAQSCAQWRQEFRVSGFP